MTLGFWKLSLSFDASSLKEDVEKLGTEDWIQHFNTGYHDGGWDGIALRAIKDNRQSLYTGNNRGNQLSDTHSLQVCPYFQSVLGAFKCRISSARILRLKANSSIREHRDYNIGFDCGVIRIHIPIVTNPDVEFYLDGKQIIMNEGECWYLDISRPHRVNNLGKTDRLHLVLDCEVNDWLDEMIPLHDQDKSGQQNAALRIAVDAIRKNGLGEFRLLVLKDPSLQEKLRLLEQRDAFVNTTLQVAWNLGYIFTAADLIAEMDRGHQTGADLWTV
ncbi:MAG TPA: aspartyl/asparaginyl beta-hydroxylase domain-containing protein [Blastocatellia bacterium]|nr:aspartyl/asparaginyl beta-hydroxylase domain-containing protein [Blastocatellia bacterium]